MRAVLQRYGRIVPFGEIAHQCIDVLCGVDGRHTGWAARRIEIVSTNNQHGNAIAPSVVNRHRGVLQADGTMAECQKGFARDFEISVRHADRKFCAV